MGLFSPDGKAWKTFSGIEDLVVLNVLFVVCCLPVVTAGASTAALYTVLFRMGKKREGYVARNFIKAFKDNFRQATILWLILFGIFCLFAVDLRICAMLSGTLAAGLRIVFLVFLFVMICLMSYAFPLTAYFSNSVWGTLKSAFWMSLGHLPFTISVLVFEALPPALCYWFPQLAWRLFIPVMVLIGFSAVGWACVQVFRVVFRQHEPERKDSEEA